MIQRARRLRRIGWALLFGLQCLAVSAETLEYNHYDLPNAKWAMLSIPYALPEGESITTVFGDDIAGDYAQSWVVFKFDPLSGIYRQLPASAALEPGVGYWIMQRSGATVTLDLPASISLANDEENSLCTSEYEACFGISTQGVVDKRRWNMLGLPYPGAVQLSELSVVGGSCEFGCELATAAEQSILHDQFWAWDGTNNSYSLKQVGDALEPWQGFWALTLELGDSSRLQFSRPTSVSLESVTSQMVIETKDAIVEGKHFDCSGSPYQALVINANNVQVKDSLFSNCYAGIIIAGKKDTVIKGNRFENVGLAIRDKDHSLNTTVTYNEFSGVGVVDCTLTAEFGWPANDYWSCAAYQSVNGSGSIFSNNIVDNRGYNTPYIEDFVNLYGSGRHFEVMNNVFIGTDQEPSGSASGGCVVLDGSGSEYTVYGNHCYHTAGYGIASAGGSNATISENRVYLPYSHVMKLSLHPHQSTSQSGTYSYGSTNYRSCADDVTISNNEGFTHHVNVFKDTSNGVNGVVDGNGVWNLNTGSCSVIEAGNTFYTSDPGWTLPEGIFDNLSIDYFSARH